MTFTKPLITDILNKVPITKYSFIISFLCILLMITPAVAFSGSGSGTSGDPYQITDVNELQEMNDDLSAL